MQHTGHPGKRGLRSMMAVDVRFAFVTKSYLDHEGRAVIDCEEPLPGGIWKGLMVYVPGGGGEEGHAQSFVPLSVSGDFEYDQGPGTQAMLLMHGPHKRPVCIGFVPHYRQVTVKTREDVAQTEDHPTVPTARDWLWVQGGGRLMLSERGALVIDSRQAKDPNVRAQLGPNGVFRVSRDGDASERPVLAGPLLEYLGKLEAYVAGLETRLEVAEKAAGVSTATLGPSRPSASGAGLRSAVVHVPSSSED